MVRSVRRQRIIEKPTFCSLEIWNLDYLIEEVEVEEVIERRNAKKIWVGITSANSRGQKLNVLKVASQYAVDLGKHTKLSG